MNEKNKIGVDLEFSLKVNDGGVIKTLLFSRYVGLDFLPPLNSKMNIDIGGNGGSIVTEVIDIVTSLGKNPTDHSYSIYLHYDQMGKPFELENHPLFYGLSSIEEYEDKVRNIGWNIINV